MRATTPLSSPSSSARARADDCPPGANSLNGKGRPKDREGNAGVILIHGTEPGEASTSRPGHTHTPRVGGQLDGQLLDPARPGRHGAQPPRHGCSRPDSGRWPPLRVGPRAPATGQPGTTLGRAGAEPRVHLAARAQSRSPGGGTRARARWQEKTRANRGPGGRCTRGAAARSAPDPRHPAEDSHQGVLQNLGNLTTPW